MVKLHPIGAKDMNITKRLLEDTCAYIFVVTNNSSNTGSQFPLHSVVEQRIFVVSS